MNLKMREARGEQVARERPRKAELWGFYRGLMEKVSQSQTDPEGLHDDGLRASFNHFYDVFYSSKINFMEFLRHGLQF